MRRLTVAMVALVAGGCGGGDDGVTIYLKQRLAADGPPGQVSAVLEPVERPRRDELPAAQQVLVQLRQGPTPDERARGFEPTLPPYRPLRTVRVQGATAYVDGFATRDFYAIAALVYSLTELPDVRRVRVCCLTTHDGRPIVFHERADFRFWSGEPCALRTSPTHVRCLRDR